MEFSDKPSGHILSRRQVVKLLGATGAILLAGGGLISRPALANAAEYPCVVRPEQTEGPYFVDERLHRSDIRFDPTNGTITPGTPLALTFQVSRIRAGACDPLQGTQVDVWHCDAAGMYSDVEDPGFNTIGKKFLRGHQLTDSKGTAEFLTIYPGWYPIRTVHIHFKIRTAPASGKSFEFTSQVYFPDDLTDIVHTALPYSSKGRRRVRNQHDFIFRHGGDQLILKPLATNGGYAVTFPIGLEF
jgi:protocatechuate 3,4-dioxygenase beta subunit